MRARWVCAATFLASYVFVVPALGSDSTQNPAPAPIAIFDRSKELFRGRARPPFVVYTLSRVERLDGVPDPENTYVTRVWFRASDGAALTRRVVRGRAAGRMMFARPRFNAPIDPGPPTADIFERAAPLPASTAEPKPSPAIRTIGTVVAPVEADYQVTLAGADAETFHLLLRPRRDPERNRLTELWVERATYAIRRAVASDRLYFDDGPGWIPDRLDISFARSGELPLIERISATTDVDADSRANGPHREAEYRFQDVTFPASLPDWYFRPETYGHHALAAPS